jgi:hypothetical protein
MMARVVALAALAVLSGCHGDVAVSPPEEPRTVRDPTALGPFVRMNQLHAERHFVSGIYRLEADTWRWCAGRAELRVRLGSLENLKFVMKYAVPAPVLEKSKVIQMRISINGKSWEGRRHDKDGIFEIEKPAPVDLLKPEAENLLTIEVDKPLPAAPGRAEMGFILVHAGFQPG